MGKYRELKEREARALEDMAVKKSLWKDVLARFLKNKSGIVGFIIVFVMILLIIFALLLTKYDYAKQSFPERFLYPHKSFNDSYSILQNFINLTHIEDKQLLVILHFFY